MTIEEELKQKFDWSDVNVQKRTSQMEREIVDHYLQAYADVRNQVNTLYEKMKFKPDLFTASQYGRLKNIEMQIASILKQAGKKMNGKTESFIKEQFAERYYEAGYAMESSLQMHLRFGLLNPKVITASVINPYDRIGWKKRMDMTHEQLNNIVKTSLTNSIIKGEGYQEATKILKGKIGQVVSNNIMRIVRTEGQRAMNWGNLTALTQAKTYAQEAGIDFVKVWSATIDKRTRDSHRDMDGRQEEKGKDGGFILPSGVWTQAPSMSGIPEEDINCRCTLITQVDGMTPKFRRVRDAKGQSQVIPNQSYHQYFNARVKTQKSPVGSPVEVKTKPVKPKAKPKPVKEKPKETVREEKFTPAKTKAGIESWMKERQKGGKQWWTNDNGEAMTKFRGTRKWNKKTRSFDSQQGKYNLSKLSIEDAQKLQTLMNEADKMCDELGIPRLQGITTPDRGAMAHMGDGVMGFNHRSVGVGLDGLEYRNKIAKQLGREQTKLDDYIKEKIEMMQKEFRRVMEEGKRPPLGVSYLSEISDDPKKVWDIFTDNTFFHEFGHHIHQNKGINHFSEYKLKSPLELKIEKVAGDLFRKLKDAEKKVQEAFLQNEGKMVVNDLKKEVNEIARRYFPSNYSNFNSHEWFAENFALWMNGQEKLLSEEFIQILKDEGIYDKFIMLVRK